MQYWKNGSYHPSNNSHLEEITLRNHSSLHKTFYSLQKNAENPVDTKVDTSGLQGAVDDASTTQTDPKHYKYTATSKS